MYRTLFKFKSTSISGSLSPLSYLSSRRETLVVTGHVTPQTLGDKSLLVWGGGWCQSVLIVAVINLVSFKSLGKMENCKESIILYSERCYLCELQATSTVK